jgi:CheY-like chemotaxis protein
MPSRVEFTEQLSDAYEHLYDLVYLRAHPLTDVLIPEPDLQRKEKAWRLHHLLLQAIEELDPGPQAPAFSHEWRRHRLMVLRYLDGVDPQAAADQLAISRRHLYREHDAAIEAIGTVLWERHVEPAPPPGGSRPVEDAPGASGLELLRLEAARMAQAGRYTRLGEVTAGVLALLQEVLRQRRLEVRLRLPEGLPGVPMDRGLLRQVLLAMLGYLIERAEDGAVELAARLEETALHLTVTVASPRRAVAAAAGEDQGRLNALEEMAALGSAQVVPLAGGDGIAGFELLLPTAPRPTILVVDDNEDVLTLFHRFLSLHQYSVVTAQTAQEALAQARRLRPYAITLDLMLPGQDGWDVLQHLLNQPETRDTPIIVCSVLKQKDLALSLGATAFLEKPVTEQALLSVLEALEGT